MFDHADGPTKVNKKKYKYAEFPSSEDNSLSRENDESNVQDDNNNEIRLLSK